MTPKRLNVHTINGSCYVLCSDLNKSLPGLMANYIKSFVGSHKYKDKRFDRQGNAVDIEALENIVDDHAKLLEFTTNMYKGC
jgi:hypothetical protein